MLNQPPKIGIVSGIGPLAGADVLTKVFKNAAKFFNAVEDYEYPDVVLINHGIKGVDNSAKLSDVFEEELITMVSQLESQGANIIGIACNTAHLYLDKIPVKPNAKLLNLIDLVAKCASGTNNNLLLTSRTTKEEELYSKYLSKYSCSYSETNFVQQQLVDQAISAIMAHDLEQAGKLVANIFGSIKPSEISTIIAGCTELPIAIDNCLSKNKFEVIDSNDVLARNLVEEYYKQLK